MNRMPKVSLSRVLRKTTRSARRSVISAVAVLLVLGRPIEAQEPSHRDKSAQLEVEHELSMTFETPHTKWAKPYAGGKTRVLFFTSWFEGSTYTREIIELMQRFDLDAEAAYYPKGSNRLLGDGATRWYVDPKAGTNRVLRMLEKPFDAFFFHHVSLKQLPDEVRSRVENRVKQGAGLVMIEEKESSPPPAWRKLAELPAFVQAGKGFTVGKGRAVVLPAGEKIAYDVGWDTTFDYRMEQQGRILLWAAGRLPQTRLDLDVPTGVIARDRLPAQAVTVNWREATTGARLRVQARRWDGHRLSLHDGPCTLADGSVRIELPVLRAGAYHVDAWLTGNRGIESWATTGFKVTSVRRAEAVQLDKPWGEIGETLSGKVRLSPDADPRDIVRVRLLDRRGRILLRKDLGPVAGTSVPFSFTIGRWMPMLLRVEAVLLNNDREVASAYAFFRVTKRRQGEYNLMVWNYPSGDLAPYGLESMARNGATAILQGGPPPLVLAAYELPYVPYASSIRPDSHTVTASLDPDGLLKQGCLNGPARRVKRVQDDVARQREAREHGVLAYSLGDENAVRASCLSSRCLDAYREYLQHTYGDIAALNAEWETMFGGFDEITLSPKVELPADDAPAWFKTFYEERLEKNRVDTHKVTPQQIADGDINDEMPALQAGNVARWYDRQMFQCYNVVQLCKRYVKEFKKIDPQALTGFEGTDSFTIRRHPTRSRQGGDTDLFIREMEYFGPYPGPGNELVRSIAPRDYPCGNWIGYAMDADTLLRKYWDQITNNMNMVQWWRWDCVEGYHGFLSPNLAPYPATREMLEDIQVVRDGLGTLLMKSDMQDDGVAMLYSLPSTYISHFDGYRRHGKLKQVHEKWFEMIHAAGLQFRYVTDRMLRLGEFDPSRYKVLILPLTLAIDPAEAEVIREFVRGGGTVIADVRPGIYDGHCKRLPTGALDDVFGIQRTSNKDPVLIDRMHVAGDIAGQKIDMRWGNWHGIEIYPQMNVDPGVKTTTGKSLGQGEFYHFWRVGAPLCVVNEFGKGRAVLLNFGVVGTDTASLVKDLLATAGVRARIGLEKIDDADDEIVEITRWRNGETELVSLFGAYTGDVRITLPEKRHVYDLKHHTDLGSVEEFKTRVLAHRAGFYALLPGPVPRAGIALDVDRGQRGAKIKAGLTVTNATGLHALRVRVSDPAGKLAEWLDRAVLVGKDRVDVDIPFAFNDPAGAWTVRATDLYTNQTVSAKVTLE